MCTNFIDKFLIVTEMAICISCDSCTSHYDKHYVKSSEFNQTSHKETYTIDVGKVIYNIYI